MIMSSAQYCSDMNPWTEETADPQDLSSVDPYLWYVNLM